MSNVFLLYMPPGNAEAMVHYQDTIKNKVSLDRISKFVPRDFRAKLTTVFGNSSVAVWGSREGPSNRSKFESMSPGDDVLIVEGHLVKLIGKVAAKIDSQELSRELWQPITGHGDTTWRLIYFIANPRELDLPFTDFCELFGYKPTFQLQGFTKVAAERLEQFYSEYDDLYSVLVRRQQGQPVWRQSSDLAIPTQSPPDLVEVGPDEIDEVLRAPTISEHIRMQWKLARLGLKAGERVWVPVGDQARLRSAYQFDSFDTAFAAGIDLPHSYVENIDVVWKQEFRIGAAYEIENSTSIYSGLLRFADLNIVAPNTLYPMFIVAPNEKKNRLREQLKRPTFRKLQLDSKVRFLSYEAIDEVDRVFSNFETGLTVDIIMEKSEAAV
jgi:hypothetical protein